MSENTPRKLQKIFDFKVKKLRTKDVTDALGMDWPSLKTLQNLVMVT